MLWKIDQLVSTGWIGVIGSLTKRQALEMHREYRRSFNRPFRVRKMT